MAEITLHVPVGPEPNQLFGFLINFVLSILKTTLTMKLSLTMSKQRYLADMRSVSITHTTYGRFTIHLTKMTLKS